MGEGRKASDSTERSDRMCPVPSKGLKPDSGKDDTSLPKNEHARTKTRRQPAATAKKQEKADGLWWGNCAAYPRVWKFQPACS